jgi:predicted phage-related endonuclease
VFCDKRDVLPEPEQSEFFEWKLDMETPILNWVERQGWTEGPLVRHVMLRSTEYPWLTSNPDALCEVVVEAKSLHGMDEKRWAIGVPDMYVVQAHVHMIVSGGRRCLVVASFGGDVPRPFWVEWDQALVDTIIESTRTGWEQIQAGVEPNADSSEATMASLRERYYQVEAGSFCDLTSEEFRDVYDALSIRPAHLAISKKAKEDADSAKGRIMQLMGDTEICRLDGEVVATWKANKNGVRSFRFTERKESE